MSKDPTEKSTRDALEIDSEPGFAVYVTMLAFNKAYKSLLDPLKLTFPQYLVMLVLWERDDLTVNDLGARLSLDSGTLTPLLKRLEVAGRVRRVRDVTDNRQVRITLTNPGRLLRTAALSVSQDILRAIGLDLERIQSLNCELALLRRGLTVSLK